MEKFYIQREQKKDILADFTPKQIVEIRYKQKILSSLAYFIGKDFSIPVELNEPGQGWHWDFKNNIIKIDPKDLLEKSLDYLRFVISHEGGHRRISRVDAIPLEVWSQQGFAFMMNAVEDPRDNNFVVECYPKFREQMTLAYGEQFALEDEARKKAESMLGRQPRFMQAGFEYIKLWFQESQGKAMEISENLPDDVRNVVEKTMKSAQDSWWRYPSKQEADDSEQLIQEYAKVSYEINRDEVWPLFKTLVDADIEDQKKQELLNELQKEEQKAQEQEGSSALSQKLADSLTPQEKKELEEAIQEGIKSSKPIPLDSLSPELQKKIAEYIDGLSEEEKEKFIKKAEKAMKEFEDDVNGMLRGKLSETPEKPEEGSGNQTEGENNKASVSHPGGAADRKSALPKEPIDENNLRAYRERLAREVHKDENIYDAHRKEVVSLIAELEEQLRPILQNTESTAWKTGYAQGKRVDIKKRIQEHARQTPAMESRAWQKRERPETKDYAVTLLVDLSGSMRENRKIDETFKAVIILAEALNALGVRLEVLGFNDDIVEYQTFGSTLSRSIREHMGGMFGEVDASCCSGCGNEHSETDIGWATAIAAERLAQQKADHKILITLSDGKIAQSRKHTQNNDIQKNVATIIKEGDVALIGLGVGKGTKQIESCFLKSASELTVKDMVKKFAGILTESLAEREGF